MRWLRFAVVTVLVMLGGFASATVGLSMPFGMQAIDTTSDTTTVEQPSSDVSISADGPSYARQGADFTVQLTVSNAGPDTADFVYVRDELPQGMEFRGATDGCSPDGSTVYCPSFSLESGAEKVISLTVRVSNGDGNYYTTYATVTVSGTDPNPDDNVADQTTKIGIVPNNVALELFKSADKGTYTVGDTVIFDIAVDNYGANTSQGATISDPLPAGMSWIPSETVCTYNPDQGPNGTVTCPAGTLPADDSVHHFTFEASADAPGSITNQATITAGPNDVESSTEDNTDTVTITVVAAYAVSLAPQEITQTLGQNVTLTATATVNGAPARNWTVTFVIASGPNSGQTKDVLTDEDGKATFTYASAVEGTDGVRAFITDDGGNQYPSNTSLVNWVAPTTTPTPPPAAPARADVAVTVSSPSFGRVGKPLTFTAVITNNGPDSATGVVLRTPVPNGAKLESASTSTGNGCDLGSSATCFVGTLASGASSTVTMVFTSATATRLAISSSAQSDNDPNTANNTSSAAANVIGIATTPPPPPPSSAPNTYNAVGTGTVTVNGIAHPADALFILDVGDIVDVTNGVITFTGFDGSFGSFSSTEFIGDNVLGASSGLLARFRVDVLGNLTLLTLLGGDFSACTAPRSLSANQKPVQGLWGSAKGSFRTKGRYASATIRGTIWLVEDRCDGTLTVDRKDPVDVLDAVLNKTVHLQPGQQYLALAVPGIFKSPTVRQSLADITRRGLFWNGRLFGTKASFVRYLKAHGVTWAAWAKLYPARAAAFSKHKK